MIMITNKNGFGLLELLVTIAIMALLLTIAVPSFTSFIPRYKRNQFINKLNSLVQTGRLRAQKTKNYQTITFDIAKQEIILEEWSNTEKKKKSFAHESYLSRPCVLPKNIEIKQLFIEGFDEIGKYTGNKKAARVWFFIAPSGKTQSVSINMIDTETKKDNGYEFSLVLNPFSGQFRLYDVFQKP